MAPDQQWSERTFAARGFLAISPGAQLSIRSHFTPFGTVFGSMQGVSQQVATINRDGPCIIITQSKWPLRSVLPYTVHVQIWFK